MSRLPTIGADSNTWGTVLNDFLSVAHNADGSLKNLFFNVKFYGAVGDGVTDNTTFIANAISAANAAGGGIVYFPPGTYITGTQLLYNNVHFLGAGMGATILLLKAATNNDLLQGSINGYAGVLANIAATQGTGVQGIYSWSIRNMTVDGNRANQSSGPSWCLRAYGQDFTIDSCVFRNGFSGGMYLDWTGTATPAPDNMEARMSNIKSHANGGTGVKFAGPHDSQWLNIHSFGNAGHGFHVGPNAGGLQALQCHPYAAVLAGTGCAYIVEAADCMFSNCQAEGSDTMQVAFLGQRNTWIGGHVYDPGHVASGVQIGQVAGLTPYFESVLQAAGVTTAVSVSECTVKTLISNCNGGALNIANSNGLNNIDIICDQTAGNYQTGTFNNKDIVHLSGTGLVADGTTSKSGAHQYAITSNAALAIRDATTNAILTVNSSAKATQLSNGTILTFFSDGFTTRTVQISGGTISVLQSTAAPALATAGTITTSSVGIARVAPTANVTGVILQSGTLAGQEVIVRNESAFTVTFDVAGTSHVADGISDVIAANRSALFEWNSVGAVWSRC